MVLANSLQTKIEDIYPTRGAEEAIFKRSNPVIFGSGEPEGPYSLNPQELEFYEPNGYLVVPQYFSDKKKRYSAWGTRRT